MDSFGNFSRCISQSADFSIPIGILFGVSVLTNIYLIVRIKCCKSRDLLEENIELVSVFKKEQKSEEIV